jgi:hypothetical protein
MKLFHRMAKNFGENFRAFWICPQNYPQAGKFGLLQSYWINLFCFFLGEKKKQQHPPKLPNTQREHKESLTCRSSQSDGKQKRLAKENLWLLVTQATKYGHDLKWVYFDGIWSFPGVGSSLSVCHILCLFAKGVFSVCVYICIYIIWTWALLRNFLVPRACSEGMISSACVPGKQLASLISLSISKLDCRKEKKQGW